MSDSRATQMEFLDRPDCDPALAAASYRFMETVNCSFGGIRLVRRFLAAETAGRYTGAPFRILDIGSGSCDIPLAAIRWARACGIPLHFTCLEMADHAIDIAHRQLARAGNPPVKLLQEDVFTHQPVEPYDYAVTSMCLHHFSNAQILVLLHRLRGCVRRGANTVCSVVRLTVEEESRPETRQDPRNLYNRQDRVHDNLKNNYGEYSMGAMKNESKHQKQAAELRQRAEELALKKRCCHLQILRLWHLQKQGR